MPREKKLDTRASLTRATERAYSAVAVVEEVTWEVDAKAAGELLEARMALERAVQYLKGETPE